MTNVCISSVLLLNRQIHTSLPRKASTPTRSTVSSIKRNRAYNRFGTSCSFQLLLVTWPTINVRSRAPDYTASRIAYSVCKPLGSIPLSCVNALFPYPAFSNSVIGQLGHSTIERYRYLLTRGGRGMPGIGVRGNLVKLLPGVSIPGRSV